MNEAANTKILNAIRMREPLPPTLISLQKLFKYADLAPGYLEMAGDDLADHMMIDGEDIQIDFLNFPNIFLTASGLLTAKPILENYISHETISEAYVLARDEDHTRYVVSNVAEILKNMTWVQLLKASTICEAEQRIFYIAEIKERSPVVLAARKIKAAASMAYTKIKHRDILKAVDSAAEYVKEEMEKDKIQEN